MIILQEALRGLSAGERPLIQSAVNRFWREWSGAFTAASREDMVGEAVIALHEGRERLAVLPKAAAERFARVAIYRRLRKRALDEFRQRLRRQRTARDDDGAVRGQRGYFLALDRDVGVRGEPGFDQRAELLPVDRESPAPRDGLRPPRADDDGVAAHEPFLA